MFSTLRNALRIGDLRRRILFTIGMFFVFRIGAAVPVPGIDHAQLQSLFPGGTLFDFLDTVSGGALKNFSVFAMGIMPYINASIIVQLLTLVIPAWEEMSKEGEEGRKTLTQYTRYLTVVLALVQALATTYGLRAAVSSPGIFSYLLIALTLTAGTAFLMWLGERITEDGIGNGISLLIFAGIVARLPAGAAKLGYYLVQGTVSWWSVVLLVIIGAVVIAAVVWITEGQRRVPVQYAKRVVGRRVYGGQTTHIPIRVNHAGVIPVIFAASILAFPPTIAQFVNVSWLKHFAAWFTFTNPWYMLIYSLLIIFFTYFYTAVTFNTVDVADNLKKYGGFIPGMRPGRPTADYLNGIVNRITLPGAIFLALVAVLPNFVGAITHIPGLWFGGTGLLIVVGVALETMKQIEAHLLMRQYQGFLR